jgi:hypothetical protein
MAIGIYFAPAAMSADAYDECLTRLRKAGAAHPPGRMYHSSFGTPDKLMVFDVWTTQAAFDRFGQTLMPILQEIGIDPGAPQVMPIRKIIVPPARKPAMKKAAPKRRAANVAKRGSATKGRKKR